jgi:hypothetical protein
MSLSRVAVCFAMLVWGSGKVGAEEISEEPPPDEAIFDSELDIDAEDLALMEDPYVYETEVRATRTRRETTRRVIDAETLTQLPGTYGDPLNAVKNLPGVARTTGFGGGLVVRGSEPEDTVYLLDGAVTPMIYHFGDLVSIVDSTLIDKVTFYPGNFSVRYGRTTAGVLDLETRAPLTQGLRASVEADLFDAGAVVEGAVSPDWSLALSGRRSYIDGILKSTGLMEDELQFTVAPRYFDFQGTADYHPSTKGHIRMTIIGADDKVKSSEEGLLTSGATDVWARLYRAQVDGEHRFGKNMRNTFGVSFTYWGVDEKEWDTDREILALPVFLRDELTFFTDKPLTLSVGTDTHLGWGRVKERYDDGRPSMGGDRFQVFPALYTELLMTALPTCELVYGLRVDYTEPIDDWSVDPRFTGACTPLDHTTFKAGIGLFHQPPDLVEMDDDFGNPNLHSTSAIHYSVGVEQTLPMYDKVSIDAEFFYKDLRRIVVWSDDWASDLYQERVGYTNDGAGRAFGLELKITHRPSKRFFGWIAYTLMKAERTDNSAKAQRFDYDQRHILTVLGNVNIGWGVTFGARFRLTTGNPYTPLESTLYNSDFDYYRAFWGKENSAEMPLFYQLDLRVDKTWQWTHVALNLYLDVQNVTNRQNVKEYAYNNTYALRHPVYDLPIIPSLGLKVEFSK